MLLSVRGGRFWDNYKDTGIPGFASVQYQTPVLALLHFPQALINSIPANQGRHRLLQHSALAE